MIAMFFAMKYTSGSRVWWVEGEGVQRCFQKSADEAQLRGARSCILNYQQECIPVGCVLSATVAICFRGGGVSKHTSPELAPLEQTPPVSRPPCCKACWDTTCNACWDSTPPLQGMLGFHLQCMLV